MDFNAIKEFIKLQIFKFCLFLVVCFCTQLLLNTLGFGNEIRTNWYFILGFYGAFLILQAIRYFYRK